MHPSSMREMETFVALLPGRPLRIADVGSRDVNGAYRPLFARAPWTYVGLDTAPGPNVDVVLSDPYHWDNVASDGFDVVVSGQTIEHVPRPWLWMRELARIVRPRGLVCVIGPHTWEYHPSPLDCWRIYPDGMRAIMEEAGLTVLVARMNDVVDTVGIAAKDAPSDITVFV